MVSKINGNFGVVEQDLSTLLKKTGELGIQVSRPEEVAKHSRAWEREVHYPYSSLSMHRSVKYSTLNRKHFEN